LLSTFGRECNSPQLHHFFAPDRRYEVQALLVFGREEVSCEALAKQDKALREQYFVIQWFLMYCVYILQSQKDGTYYTGFTTDIADRLRQHNNNEAKFTSTKSPYKLVWCCLFKDKLKALKFEKYLKHGSGFAFARKRLV
jgi:putative endonuclease